MRSTIDSDIRDTLRHEVGADRMSDMHPMSQTASVASVVARLSLRHSPMLASVPLDLFLIHDPYRPEPSSLQHAAIDLHAKCSVRHAELRGGLL